MADLGRLGVVQPVPESDDPDTFEWFGSSIRVNPSVNQIELIDFMESIDNIEASSLLAMVAVKNGFRVVIEPDDFDLFWKLARENRQDIDTLTSVFMLLITGETERPTQRQSDSSDGLPPISENLPGVSTLPVMPGRPDLVVLREDSAAERQALMKRAMAG